MIPYPLKDSTPIRPNAKADGFVDVLATALTPGMRDSQGHEVLHVARGRGTVWTPAHPGGVSMENAVLVTIAHKRGPTRTDAFHPNHRWYGIRADSVSAPE